MREPVPIAPELSLPFPCIDLILDHDTTLIVQLNQNIENS